VVASPAVNAAEALSELRELSSQVERAVILEAGGDVLAGTDADPAEAQTLAGTALALVAAAGELHGTATDVTRVEVELAEGALFVLREQSRTIAATTGPNPTSGLVVYDLRTCLHSIEEKPKRRRAKRKAEEEQETSQEQETKPQEQEEASGEQ
jgi:uncharacterized membrane protein